MWQPHHCLEKYAECQLNESSWKDVTTECLQLACANYKAFHEYIPKKVSLIRLVQLDIYMGLCSIQHSNLIFHKWMTLVLWAFFHLQSIQVEEEHQSRQVNFIDQSCYLLTHWESCLSQLHEHAISSKHYVP